VIEVIKPLLVKISDGSLVSLGQTHNLDVQNSNLSSDFLRQFKKGFPENWRDLTLNALKTTATQHHHQQQQPALLLPPPPLLERKQTLRSSPRLHQQNNKINRQKVEDANDDDDDDKEEGDGDNDADDHWTEEVLLFALSLLMIG
jgi:hypothetical protein